jgi:hypothetical protein
LLKGVAAAHAALCERSLMLKTRFGSSFFTRFTRSTLAGVLGLTVAGCGGDPGTPDGGTNPDPCVAQEGAAECGRRVHPGQYHIYSVTKDNAHALAMDDSSTLSAVSLADGSTEVVQTNAKVTFTFDKATFIWHDAGTSQGHSLAQLALWTHDGHTVQLDPSTPLYRGLARGSGDYIAWVGNVSSDGSTGDVYLDRLDHSAPRKLQSGISLNLCGLRLAFAANSLVVSACSATIDPATNVQVGSVTAYDLATGAPAVLSAVPPLQMLVDASSSRVVIIDQTGAISWINADGSQPSPLATDGSYGKLSGDGSQLVYVDNSDTPALHRVALAGGPPVLVQPAPIDSVQEVSRDGSLVVYSTQFKDDTVTTDLWLSTTTGTPSTPLVLRQPPDTTPIGKIFTPDSKFAVFSGAMDASYNAALWVQPVLGGAPFKLSDLSFWYFNLDADRLLYSDHLVEGPLDANGFAVGTTDVELIDLAAGTPTPTTLVTAVDGQFFSTWDNKTLVYARRDNAATSGIYTMPIPH